MTDLELLFLVLGIIYVWECGWWAGRELLGVRTWLGTHWSIVQPSRAFGNQRAGVILAHPLPPLGTLLASHCFPFSLTPEAMLAYIPPSIDPARRSFQSGKHFRWDEIQSVQAQGKKILVNGQLLLKTPFPALALRLADKLNALRKTKVADRKKAIEQLLEESFDTNAIERRWKEFSDQARSLTLAANLLFFYVFLLAPLAFWRLSFSFSWPFLLVGLLCCTLTIALQFHRIHKRFFPDDEDERFTHFIVLLLSPASAIRARDLISRPLLEFFHPLAVARVFCSEREFKKMAPEFLRELRYPIAGPALETAGQKTESYARELALSRLEEFLRRNSCLPDQLLQPPVRADQSSLSYCPRCLAQFTLRGGSCPDCETVKLVDFIPAEKGSEAKEPASSHGRSPT